MKTLSILALCTAIVMASCQKSSVSPSLNATTENDVITAKRSNFDLLTAHTWMYVKYYTNYIDSSNPGQLSYKRGRASNSINLDLNRVTFNVDGTVNEIDQNGNSVPGTWNFTNSEQTTYVVTNSYGSFYTNIDNLTNKRFEWTGPYAHVHGLMTIAP